MLSHRIPRWVVVLFFLICFVGFLDATYLAAKHYLGSPVTCTFLKGCEVVTTSKYAKVFGISVALLGSFYYLLQFILTIVYFDTKKLRVLTAAGYISCLGFFASAMFVYLQVFVLRALCFYCLMSAATSTILFILGLFIVYRSRQLPL